MTDPGKPTISPEAKLYSDLHRQFHEELRRRGYVIFASGGWYRVPDDLIPLARIIYSSPDLGSDLR